MKAIILTYAPVSEKEKNILKQTEIFKIALNQHAEEFAPNIRIITDYVLPDMLKKFSQKIVSVREKLRYYSSRVEYFLTEFKGSTIIAAIEYLISKQFNEILIVGNNSVNSQMFQNIVNNEINKINHKSVIYQYTNGNFNLPNKSVSDFCNIQ